MHRALREGERGFPGRPLQRFLPASDGLGWSVWGRVDAEAAWREAEERNSAYLWRVLQGAGYGNPWFAIRLLDDHPALNSAAVQSAIMSGLKGEDAEEALDYMFSRRTLESWASSEPIRAFDWAVENGRKISTEFGAKEVWVKLVGRMLEVDPAYLDRVIDQLPPGSRKRSLELARVKAVAVQDIDRALAMAEGATTAAQQAELLAGVGKAIVADDPARSLELFRKVAGADVGRSKPGGYRGPTGVAKRLHDKQWIAGLLAHDPGAVVESAHSASDGYLLPTVVGRWMRQDMGGLTRWMQDLPDEVLRTVVARRVVLKFREGPYIENGLSGEEDPEGALRWIAEVHAEEPVADMIPWVISEWVQNDPEEAAAYLGTGGEASAELRAVYEKRKGGRE